MTESIEVDMDKEKTEIKKASQRRHLLPMVGHGIVVARGIGIVAMGVLEVVNGLVLLEERLELGHDIQLVTGLVLAVEEVGPEFLQTVHVSVLEVRVGQCLKVQEQILTELLLESIRVEPEETLETVPVVGIGILDRQPLELGVHLLVEVVTQEVRPETEERVHLLGVSCSLALALLEGLGVVLVVLVLDESVLVQKLVRGVLEGGERVRSLQRGRQERSLGVGAHQHTSRRVADRLRRQVRLEERLVTQDPSDGGLSIVLARIGIGALGTLGALQGIETRSLVLLALLGLVVVRAGGIGAAAALSRGHLKVVAQAAGAGMRASQGCKLLLRDHFDLLIRVGETSAAVVVAFALEIVLVVVESLIDHVVDIVVHCLALVRSVSPVALLLGDDQNLGDSVVVKLVVILIIVITDIVLLNSASTSAAEKVVIVKLEKVVVVSLAARGSVLGLKGGRGWVGNGSALLGLGLLDVPIILDNGGR